MWLTSLLCLCPSDVTPGAATSRAERAAAHDAVLEGSVVVTARASQPPNRLSSKVPLQIHQPLVGLQASEVPYLQ